MSGPVVFVVDDDPSVREGLESLIRAAGHCVQSFGSARSFLAFKRPDLPSCLVLDVRMPGLSGLELQDQLTKAGMDIPIIFITGHGDIPMTVRAMKAGAVEFLTKPLRDRDLLSAIQHCIAKDRAARGAHAQMAALSRRYDALTRREREVMALVVAGLRNKQIAGELGIKEITVKVHRAQVMQKMQAASLAALVQLAERLNVIIPPNRQTDIER
jgi:FixJ family two-component response regulator